MMLWFGLSAVLAISSLLLQDVVLLGFSLIFAIIGIVTEKD